MRPDFDQMKAEMEERYGVEVNIQKEPVFRGFSVVLSYPYWLNGEKRYQFARYHEVLPADWGTWWEEMDQTIQVDLSLF